jgi:hypothetical protein
MTDTPTTFIEPTWAIVELFGHGIIAGQISEVTIAGGAMLRVDVPPVNGNTAYTKFFGAGAIYAITPSDQTSAIHAAAHIDQPPINQWTIPFRDKMLPPGHEEVDF